MKLLSMIPKLTKHVILIRNWRSLWYQLLEKHMYVLHTKHTQRKINESTSFAIDNMYYVNFRIKNKKVYLSAMKFKTKDYKYLGTLLIFTLIPLVPKKCGLSISLYICVQGRIRECPTLTYKSFHSLTKFYMFLSL